MWTLMMIKVYSAITTQWFGPPAVSENGDTGKIKTLDEFVHLGDKENHYGRKDD